MEIEDFRLVGNNEITWEYEGVQYCIKKNNIETYNILYNRILFLVISDGNKKIHTEYYDFYGKLIFSFNREDNVIHCFGNRFKIERSLMARYDFVHDRLLCIVGDKIGPFGQNHLEYYDKNGNLLRKVKAPIHYGFYGFFDLTDGSLDLVLLGDSSTADEFGRTQYRFKYNFETDELTKYGLSY